mgnify:CR=1 FL=1
MKKVALLLMIVYTAISCSSSDSVEDVIPVLPNSLIINGIPVELPERIYAYYYEHYFELYIRELNLERTVIITFDKYGNFISAGLDKDFQYSESYPYFSSNYFDFEMTPINMAAGECIIDFSGTVYENKYDMTSTSITISGHITLQSMNQEQGGGGFIYNMGLLANVDGENWFSKNKVGRTYDSGYYNCYYVSDDEYRLVFNVNGDITPNGQHNFTANTIHDCIKVEKFNTATLTYEPWDTEGSMNITGRLQPYDGGYFIDGSFNLIARNPYNSAEIVHFNNGVFKALPI